MESIAGALATFWILALILVIIWIALPFAVFGIKPLLRQLIQEQRRTNELLELRRTASKP